MAVLGKTKKYKNSMKHEASKSQTEEAIKKSLIAYKQGDLEGAKILLDTTLQTDKANSFVLGFLATVEKALGNKERALQLFKRSTDITQNNSDILHNYSILVIDKDSEKAISLSDKAVNISPNNSRYLLRNGYLKWIAGDLDNTPKVTKKAIRLDPSLVDAHLNLGGIYIDLGQLDQALVAAKKVWN